MLSAGRLAEARAVAEEFASRFRRRGVVGVVFLGALARGYFDEYSDIDIVVFKRRGVRLGVPRERELEYKGFLVDYEVRDYEDELRRPWSMEERWAFSHAVVHYDPEGRVARLLKRKVPLREGERRRLLRESLRWAAWYGWDFADSWVRRGDLANAHHCVTVALELLVKALFLLNGQLVPPDKWLLHEAAKLGKLPPNFAQIVREALLTRDFTAEELERRKAAVAQLRAWLEAGTSPS
ncbi:MAG: nucleotidyltransferase domain-containing protein [Thermofilum sp.]|nr:nucleotidyltransferase domain-containing protein [Thermofilum sp.]